MNTEAQDFQGMAQMPQYQCHKKVCALKIKEIYGDRNSIEDSEIFHFIPEQSGFAHVKLPPEYMKKHKPKAGGYYVVYEDSYQSYSPAKAFENGYTLI